MLVAFSWQHRTVLQNGWLGGTVPKPQSTPKAGDPPQPGAKTRKARSTTAGEVQAFTMAGVAETDLNKALNGINSVQFNFIVLQEMQVQDKLVFHLHIVLLSDFTAMWRLFLLSVFSRKWLTRPFERVPLTCFVLLKRFPHQPSHLLLKLGGLMGSLFWGSVQSSFGLF